MQQRHLSSYGLPSPRQGPYQRLRTTGVTVAVDQGFVGHLKAGRLEIVAEVDRFAGPEVVLRNGRRLRPDVVLAATGFRRGLEPLVGHLDVLDAAGLPRGGSGAPSPGAPGLWFVGYRTAIEGNLRQHAIEGRRIAHAIAQARSNARRWPGCAALGSTPSATAWSRAASRSPPGQRSRGDGRLPRPTVRLRSLALSARN
jgi:putative flavoprotein involved in K+ transport